MNEMLGSLLLLAKILCEKTFQRSVFWTASIQPRSYFFEVIVIVCSIRNILSFSSAQSQELAVSENGGGKKKRKAPEPKDKIINYGDGVTEETSSYYATSNTIVKRNGVVIAKIEKQKGNNMNIEISVECEQMTQQITLSIGATLGPEGLTMDSLGGGKFAGTILPPLHQATISRGNISTNGLPRIVNGCMIISNNSTVRSGRGGMISSSSSSSSSISFGGSMSSSMSCSSNGGMTSMRNCLNGVTMSALINNGSYGSFSSVQYAPTVPVHYPQMPPVHYPQMPPPPAAAGQYPQLLPGSYAQMLPIQHSQMPLASYSQMQAPVQYAQLPPPPAAAAAAVEELPAEQQPQPQPRSHSSSGEEEYGL